VNILLTNASGIYAGGEFFVFSLASELSRRGHSVNVACAPSNLLAQKCRDAGIRVFPIDFPANGRLFHFIRVLTDILRRHQIDIIHTNTNYDRTAGAFAAARMNIPHVSNIHSFHSIQHNLTQFVRNRYCTRHFIVDGVCVRDLLMNKDGISPEKISVVYLGLEPDRKNDEPRQQDVLRKELSIPRDAIVLGNVARLVPFKGHEILLQSFAEIQKDFPDTRLLLVGDGELRDELQSIAIQLGIAEKIIFAGFRDDLESLYSIMDIYIHPSVEGGGETFPFAVLQALRHELPVVVTRVGDVWAMVDEGKNGFIVPDRDVAAISQAVRRLIADRDLRNRMGESSRKILLERFTLSLMVDNIERIYRSVAAKKG